MGRKHTVAGLPQNEIEYIIDLLNDGKTDREISAEFEKKFDKKLPKSSLNTWIRAVGKDKAKAFQIVRVQAREIVKQLRQSEDADKYQVIIEGLEDHLLTAAKETFTQSPIKLLLIRQEEERLRIKRQELQLKTDQLEFDKHKHANVIDRVTLGGETLKDFLEYAGDNTGVVEVLTKHLKPFGAFLKKKYGAAEKN